MKEEKLYNKYIIKSIERGSVALLCIDIQYSDAAPGYGFFKNIKREDNVYKYYFDRLEDIVIPNIRKLQKKFREEKEEVIHSKIESLTKDGRDRSLAHKRMGCHVIKGTKDAQILEEVSPIDDEIVITKTASGIFNSTNIDYVLKNIGVNQLVIVGVLTNECIENAVRAAADKSYDVILVEDAVAAFEKRLHDNTLEVLNGVYATVISSDEVIALFD